MKFQRFFFLHKSFVSFAFFQLLSFRSIRILSQADNGTKSENLLEDGEKKASQISSCNTKFENLWCRYSHHQDEQDGYAEHFCKLPDLMLCLSYYLIILIMTAIFATLVGIVLYIFIYYYFLYCAISSQTTASSRSMLLCFGLISAPLECPQVVLLIQSHVDKMPL